MSESISLEIGEWNDRLLYTLFIGKQQGTAEISAVKFDPALKLLTDGIKRALGAYTRVRFLEAVGDTLTWGQEPSTLVLVITDIDQKQFADSTIAQSATRLAEQLKQDAIWITRMRLDLFIAQPSDGQR